LPAATWNSRFAEQQLVAYLNAVKGGNRIPYKINVRKYAYEARTYYEEVRGKRQAKVVHKFCEAPHWVEETQRQTRDKPREYDGQNIHKDRSCTTCDLRCSRESSANLWAAIHKRSNFLTRQNYLNVAWTLENRLSKSCRDSLHLNKCIVRNR